MRLGYKGWNCSFLYKFSIYRVINNDNKTIIKKTLKPNIIYNFFMNNSL